MKILAVAGARPNFMKIAPVVSALTEIGADVSIVHTGQHYDQKMSDKFFDDLQIPAPARNLGVGSGSHVWQIAEVMKRLEPEFHTLQPDVALVVGDVNSTVAAAIAAVKNGIPVAHVEAGLRSFDRTMPEETNRVLTDSISRWLFTSEPAGRENLLREGIPEENIHFVGNVMIDTLIRHREQAVARRVHEQLGLQAGGYAVLTLHRPSNVDDREHLESILRAVHALSDRVQTVFVMHPRTKGRMAEFGFANSTLNGFLTVEPLGYIDMLSLMCSARFVMTDSGGMQEETTALGIPCLTLRENTERPVTIDVGTNELVGWRSDQIISRAREILDGRFKKGQAPENWDGLASDRIAHILDAHLK